MRARACTATHKFTVAFQRRWVYAVASKNVNSDKKPGGKKKGTQIAVGTSVFTKSTVCFANQPREILRVIMEEAS